MPILLKLGGNYCARNERGESAFDVAGMYTEQVRVDMQQYLNQLSREVKTEAIEKLHISRVCTAVCVVLGEGESGNGGLGETVQKSYITHLCSAAPD